MTFSTETKALLEAKLSASAVKSREQGGRNVSYIEGWHCIAEANRIFGFDNWTRETIELKCVAEKEREIGKNKIPGWGVTYTCKVRVMVLDVVREGCGAGHGIDKDLGQAHESALKEAETDAMKRALMTFGNPFGLALYDKEQTNVADEADESRQRYVATCHEKILNAVDPVALRAWWNEHKSVRRDFELTKPEVDALVIAITAKLKALDTAAKAA